MNYLIYDLIIAAILLLFVELGRKRGFVLTLCGLLAMFVAFAGAGIVSNLLCDPVAKLIEPMIETSITQVLGEAVEQIGTVSVTELPAAEGTVSGLSLEQALAALQVSGAYRMFSQSLQNALAQGLLSAVTNAATSIAVYLSREVARMALFLIFFAVILLASKLLSKMLDLAFRLPVLSTINRTLGGVIGLVKGGLLVFIGVWLLKNYLPPQALTETWLLRFFAENTPLTLLAMV